MDNEYKATQLWNNIIRAFQSQLPLKVHRKNFKTFDKSFTGCEAIDWLHGYLCAKTDDPEKITRTQSQILLRKFHDHGLFCEVARKDKVFDDCSVKDDNTIYRFHNLSPTAIARTPLALKLKASQFSSGNSGHPEKSTPPIPKMPKLWKTTSEEGVAKENCHVTPTTNGRPIRSLQQILGSNSQSLYTKNGQPASMVVTQRKIWTEMALSRLQKLLQLNTLESCLDVDAVDENFTRFNCENFTARGVAKVQRSSDELPQWILQAMKCLANWPWYNNALNLSCYDNFERDVFANILEFYKTQGCPLIPDELRDLFISTLNRAEFLDACQWDKSYYLHTSSNETDFTLTGANFSPESLGHNDEFDMTEIVSEVYRPKYADDFFDAQSFVDSIAAAPFNRTRSFGRANFSVGPLARGARSRASFASSAGFPLRHKTFEDALNSLPGLVKSPTLMGKIRDTKTSSAPVTAAANQQARPGAPSSAYRTEQSCNFGSNNHAATLSFFTKIGRQTAVEAVQLCLLFLPAKNRRWLQLLLRLMNKISVNFCLKLDKFSHLSNRSLMIESFCDCIFSAKPLQSNRSQAIKLLSFLLDLEREVFEQPVEFVQVVSRAIENAAEAEKGRISVASSASLTYCQQIPLEFFEYQGASASHEALVDLLDSIVKDKAISLAEKKKRLKKFEKSYPNLFVERFPTKASLKSLLHRQHNAPKPKFVPFSRFKAMRI